MDKGKLDEIERQMRMVLKAEYEAKERITKRADELEEIVALAIAACQDSSPFLANMLLGKAESIFGKKPTFGG